MNMTEVTIGCRVKISEDALFQELQGEAVVLDLKTGVYFGLDRVGARMWELLAENRTVAQVVEGIVHEYEVTEDRCTGDALALVLQLQQQGLLAVA